MTRPPAHPLRYSVHTRLREYQLGRMMRGGGGKLLDIGCGVGYLTRALGGGYRTVGLEYDFESLKVNVQNGMAMAVRGGAWELPIKSGSLDAVLCSEVFEHMPDGKDLELAREIARVLRPGGRAYVTVPALEGLRSRAPLRNIGHDIPGSGEYHYRLGYSADDMRRVISGVPGLKVARMRHSMALFSELFMDLLKLVYLKKNKMKEQSDLMSMGDSPLFKIYRAVFPILHALFVAEDFLLCPVIKGHILVAELEKV
ncbi:MAG: class I SAM-dependent methyltransferase [Nitrospinae bacterium]|nr:class I SAM-dependent methyltransferase [Nitrospinota bacterium]